MPACLWWHLSKWFACRLQLRKLLVVGDLRLWPASADNEVSVYSKRRTECRPSAPGLPRPSQSRSPSASEHVAALHFSRYWNLMKDCNLNRMASCGNENKRWKGKGVSPPRCSFPAAIDANAPSEKKFATPWRIQRINQYNSTGSV